LLTSLCKGHNFGIVTKAKFQTFSNTNEWKLWILTFDPDELGEVVNFLEAYSDQKPPELTVNFFLGGGPNDDPRRPLFRVMVQYFGHLSWESITAPFQNIASNALQNSNWTTPWTEASAITAHNVGGILCEPSITRRLRFNTKIPALKIDAVQKVYDWMANLPEAWNSTYVLYRYYGLATPPGISSRDTAYPDRGDDIHFNAIFDYQGAEMDQEALELGQQARELSVIGTDQDGREPMTYVNYAIGTEGPKAWYGGSEESETRWRLKKLRKLKRKWDPENV
jgi:hypothetical protein